MTFPRNGEHPTPFCIPVHAGPRADTKETIRKYEKDSKKRNRRRTMTLMQVITVMALLLSVEFVINKYA